MTEKTQGEATKNAAPFDLFVKLGSDIVAKLEASDYETLEDLAAAPDGDLRAIDGIGPATVRKMRILMAEAGVSEDPDADLPDAQQAQGQVKRDHKRIIPSEIVTGPVADDKSGPVAMRSLGAYVYKWKGEKYNLLRGQDISGLPKDLQDEMQERGEAAMRPPFR